MKTKKYNYYTIDTGFLNAPVKLCFSAEAFNDILKDHGINTKEKALDLGQAETHYFQQDKAALIIVVFDYDDMVQDDDFSNIFATITHESVHIVQRIFDYVGEEEAGEEIYAYLTEWIVKQILKGFTTERDKRHVGKTNRAKIKPSSKTGRGSELQVDQLSKWSSGSVSVSELTNILSRVKNGDGQTEL